jgi:hypothetical protein
MVKDRFPSNDRIPLFLSDPAEKPEQPRIRKVVSSDIFRKVVLVFVTASQVSTPAPQDGSGHSVPAIQSTASAEALPGTAPGDELLAAFKSALESKTEVDPPRAEALFNQFQAWAADAQAPPQPVQDVRTPPLPKRRPIQAARAQDPSPQNAQSLMRRFGWRN